MSSFYMGDDVTLEDADGDDGVIVLLAGGDLDFSASPQLKERIAEHVDAGRKQLVIDLSPATFIFPRHRTREEALSAFGWVG
jgi:hypothetical protein